MTKEDFDCNISILRQQFADRGWNATEVQRMFEGASKKYKDRRLRKLHFKRMNV